jgi:hypothetical protein
MRIISLLLATYLMGTAVVSGGVIGGDDTKAQPPVTKKAAAADGSKSHDLSGGEGGEESYSKDLGDKFKDEQFEDYSKGKDEKGGKGKEASNGDDHHDLPDLDDKPEEDPGHHNRELVFMIDKKDDDLGSLIAKHKNLIVIVLNHDESNEKKVDEVFKHLENVEKKLQEDKHNPSVSFGVASVDQNEGLIHQLDHDYDFKKGDHAIYKVNQELSHAPEKLVGEMTEENLTKWAKELMIVSKEGKCEDLVLDDKHKEHHIVFFGSIDSPEYKNYFAHFDRWQLGENTDIFHVNDEECAKKYGATKMPAVVMIGKDRPNGMRYGGKFEDENDIHELEGWALRTLIPAGNVIETTNNVLHHL